MIKPILALKIPVTIAMLIAAPGFGQAVFAPDLIRPESGETIEVLVQYKTQPTSNRLLHGLAGKNPRLVKKQFEHIPVAHLELNSEELAALARDPEIVSISPDREVTAYLDRTADPRWYRLSPCGLSSSGCSVETAFVMVFG